MENRKEFLTQKFRTLFKNDPELWSRAPGRVDLMGSHTDYNLGYVMTMAIDRDTWIAARPRTDGKVRLHSLDMDSGAEFSLDDLAKTPTPRGPITCGALPNIAGRRVLTWRASTGWSTAPSPSAPG